MFKVTITTERRYSKLTIETTEGRQWRLSGVFIINFEHILIVPIVNFEQGNVSRVDCYMMIKKNS